MRLFLIIAFIVIGIGSTRATDKFVVASNAWTAAYAKEAGLTNVKILAPAEMLHPSEYELSVEDILLIKKADWVIVGGYELLVKYIKKNRFMDSSKLLSIKTSYNYNEIKQSVLVIADKLDTRDVAMKNLTELKLSIKKHRTKYQENGWDNVPVLVHFFQQSFANELGLTVAGIYGPAAPEAFEIAGIMRLDFDLIIDNVHNPVGQSIERSSKKIERIELLNFPGTINTRRLLDVINYNVKTVEQTMKKIESN